jgi:hypothetical protein
MSANEYHFVTGWRVESTVEEISDVLGDPTDLTRRWPAVYLAVTQGWLPYTLHWFFRVTESRRPYGFLLQAWGDFEGTGILDLCARGTLR